MNALFPIEGVGLWQTAGWTMLHFLWLGMLVGLAAILCRLLLRRAAPNVRYGVALGVLVLLGALPIGIAAWLLKNPPAALPLAATSPAPAFAAAVPLDAESTGPIIELSNRDALQPAEPMPAAPGFAEGYPAAPDVAAVAGVVDPRTTPLTLESALAWLESCVPYLPWLWLVGTPLTFLLLATGLIGSERLRQASRAIDDGPIADAAVRLLHTLQIGRRVTVAVCERIAAPVLIGIVRPIILLPPAALTGWSPDEIEMVLLHELAHVRRWDNLVNLAQRCLESLLFFHPAVWLVSNWVRRERETCCDAVVVARTNRPHAYAEMLVALAAQMPRSVLFHPAASSAMAAGPLRARIRHILQLEEDPMLVSGKSFAMVLGSVVVAATLAVLYLPTLGQAEESASEKSTTQESKTEELTTEDTESATIPPELEAATQNKLKQLMSALQNYHDTYKKFPAFASVDANGKPLLSWRVLILPLLGEVKLYEEFHLDEPWDSEHNRKLIERMPEAFKNPKLNEPGKTNYLAIVGAECVFDGTPKGISLRQIPDGTAKTLALLEANADQSVAWTKPQDWRFDRWHPTAGLGSLWGDHWYGALVDGSVRRINNTEPAEEVGILFTRAGGEARNLSESEGRGHLTQSSEVAGMGRESGSEASSSPLGAYGAAGPEVGYPSLVRAVGNPTHKFPSLEDQKLADLAWKRLGIELEQISGEDLKRVQALGYEGGLKVTSTGIELQQQQQMQQQQGVRRNDILVGLHVWPTTNLKQVAEILNRDDLMELNPLKYYVVRLGEPGAGGDAYGRGGFGGGEVGPKGDTVFSGRLNVQSDRTTRRRQSSTEPAPVGGPWPTISPQPAPPQLGPTKPDPWPAVAPTPSSPSASSAAPTTMNRYGTPTPADPNDWDSQPQPQPQSRVPATEPPSSVAKVLPGTPRATRAPRSDATVVPGPAEADETEEESVLVPTRPRAGAPAFPAPVQPLIPSPFGPKLAPAPGLMPRAPMGAEAQRPAEGAVLQRTPNGELLFGPPTAPPTPAQGKAQLRYDGMTFNEWSNAWRTELSTEKRLEAVKALAAFGRAGYGKEATEAILDVAGEYDFSILEGDRNEEGKLKEILVAELAPEHRRHSLATFWVPDLARRLEKEPKQWQWLAYWLLARLKTDDPDTLAILQSLAQSGPGEVRSAALSGLVRCSRSREGVPRFDDKTRELLAAALKSADLNEVRNALSLLLYFPQSGGGGVAPEPKLVFLPELVPLLFHADEEIRKQARWTLRAIQEKDAPSVLQELVAVLKDESRRPDHPHAIRALAALGENGKSAIPELIEVLKASDDLPTRDAAMVALVRCGAKRAVFGDGNFNYDAINEVLTQHATQAQREQITNEFNAPRDELGSGEQRIQRLTDENNAILPAETQGYGMRAGGGFF